MSKKKSIAIIGIGCKFPGDANSPDQLWDNLINKVDAITEIPEDRWNMDAFYHPDPAAPRMSYTKWGGFVKNLKAFDPAAFGITPREAKQMDPQQRFLLEVTNNAFYDAGYEPSQFKKQSVGVFVGISTFDYFARNLNHLYAEEVDVYSPTGVSLSIAANRISYIFDLWGPSMIIDTACSSSLLALHLAAEAIQNGDCEYAITGGVNAILEPHNHVAFSKMGLLSPVGRCKAFSEEASGFVRSEGAGAVLLKSLDKAVEDGDRIYAIIRATGTNQDGKTNGIAVPNQDSQEALYHKVYRSAEIDPAQIDYVEAHGTGTIVGDQIETGSIGKVIGKAQGRKKSCRIGSIKTNIGHLEAGSGVAGLIKACLVLHHKAIPPNLHFEKPSSYIDFDDLNLKVVDEYTTGKFNWAAVNSFGFGGANVHAVLEAAPRQKVKKTKVQNQIVPLVISAPDQERLSRLEANYASWLEHTDHDALRIAQATWYTRPVHRVRSVLLGRQKEDWIKALTNGQGEANSSNYVCNEEEYTADKVAFVFSGQGPQWHAMGNQLFKENSTFRSWIKRCDRHIQSLAGWSLVEELNRPENESKIQDTKFAQPAIAAFQIALARTLQHFGIHAKGVVGHSIGEIAAGYIAGAYSLSTAMKIIVRRGESMGDHSKGGKMIAVNIPQNDLYQLTYEKDKQRLSVAAMNSPISFTLAGSAYQIRKVAKKCEEQKLFKKVLRVDHAFHSSYMDDVKEPLIEALKTIRTHEPELDMMSTVTAEWITTNQLGADYWWQNVRKPVKFFPAVSKMIAEGDFDTFIEISPHPVLMTSMSYISKTFVDKELKVVPTIYRKEDESLALMRALGKLHCLDYPVDWTKVLPKSRVLIGLPEYPYLKEDFWQESQENILLRNGEVPNQLLGKQLPGPPLIFSSLLDPMRFPFLKDHRLRDQMLFPATAYIEIFLGLSKFLHPQNKAMQIEELKLLKALTFKDDNTHYQSYVRFDETMNEATFYSRDPKHPEDWTMHSSAIISSQVPQDLNIDLPSIPEIKARLGDSYPGMIHYYYYDMNIFKYGPSFRGIERFWVKDSDIVVEVKADDSLTLDKYIFHPAFLDIIFQSSTLNLKQPFTKEAARYTLVPVRTGKIYHTGHKVTKRLQFYIHKTLDSPRSSAFDAWVFNDQNELLLKLTDASFYGIEVGGNNDGAYFDDWSYYTYWKELESRKAARSIANGNGYLPKSLVQDLNQISAKALWSKAYKEEFAPDTQERIRKKEFYERVEKVTDSSALIKSIPIISKSNVGLHQNNGYFTINEPSRKSIINRLVRKYPNHYPLLNAFIDPVSQEAKNLIPSDLFHQSGPDLIERISDMIMESQKVKDTEEIHVVEISGPNYQPICFSLIGKMGKEVEYTVVVPTQEALSHFRNQTSDISQLSLALADQVNASFWKERKPDLVIAYHLEWIADAKKNLLRPKSMLRYLAPQGRFIGIMDKQFELWQLTLINNRALWDPLEKNGQDDFILPEENASLFISNLLQLDNHDQLTVSALDNQLIAEYVNEKKIGRPAPSVPTDEPGEVRSYVVLNNHSELVKGLTDHNEEGLQIHILETNTDSAVDLGEDNCLVYIFPDRSEQAFEIEEAIQYWYQQIDMLRSVLLAEDSSYTKCIMVTTNSTSVSEQDRPPHLVFAGLPGMIQSIRTELSSLPTHWLDLDQGDDRLSHLIHYLKNPLEELDLAIRQGKSYGRRFKKGSMLAPEEWMEDVQRSLVHTQYRLDMGMRNTIDSLFFKEMPATDLPEGCVEIQVKAAALNFRDVLKVLGMYPSDSDDYLYLGDECSGVISRIGKGVRGFQVGDEVFGIVRQGFASHVVTHQSVIFKKPKNITFNEATTLPVIFLTAYYSLVHVARLKKGETVLIHAAAGGVGLAAIQIAQQIGAKVIATASLPKQALLKSLGVKHVFNSRDTAFLEQIKMVTGDRGVDVVLNSLAGEFQENSMQLMAPFGRFVEIGKRDIYEDRKTGLYKFRENVSFHIVDLSALLSHDSKLINEVTTEIFSKFSGRRKYYPVCHTVYSTNEIQQAFRYMSKGGHIGKIVISFEQKPYHISPALPAIKKIDPDATYIISGGTKGFGAEFITHLILNRARHVVVLSRSGKFQEAKEMSSEIFDKIKHFIHLHKVDVGDAAALKKTIGQIKKQLPPIKGIIHAASIYRDQLMVDIDKAAFEQLCQTKSAGAWYLHQLTLDQPLDFFIMTSSIASSMGSAGQLSYSTANSFLDQLAQYRQRLGLPATTINYGPIKDAGFVQRNEQIANRMNRLGIELLPSRLAVQLTEFARNSSLTNVSAMRMNFQNWVGMSGTDGPPSLYEEVYSAKQEDSQDLNQITRLISRIKSLDMEAAHDLVCEYVKQTTAQILGIESKQIGNGDAFQEIGLDSLMAVEMQYKIERSFNIKISPVEVSKDPTISGLAQIIVKNFKAE